LLFTGCNMPSSRRQDDSESGSDSDSDLEEFFKKRRCTDPICCLLFVAAMAALIGMLVYGTKNGNLRKINHGFDAVGRQCGVNETVEDKPLLYFCPLVKSSGVHTVNMKDPVCVAACPTLDFDGVTLTPSMVSECENQQAYATVQVGNRYCLPDGSEEAVAREEVKQGMSDAADDFLNTSSKIGRGWQIILLTLVVATAMGYIFLCLLKTLAKCIIYVCAFVGLVAFLLLGWFLFTQSAAQAAEGEDNLAITFKVLAIISWALALIVVSLICCCGQAVELSTACMGQAASVIWRMPVLLLSPLVKAFVKCGVLIVLAAGFVHLLSTGETSGIGRDKHWSFSGEQKLMLASYVFISFWLLAFISALYQFSIAHAVGQYYMASNATGTKETKCCAVFEGVYVGLRYHGGSLAFGSAVIAALEFIQRILEWAEKKSQLEHNQVLTCILSCILCACRCLEGIIQFINKNAYIDIAITSSGFCTAVQNVMHIIVDHGAAMAILNGATFIFQIVGLASITATCGLLSAYLLTGDKYSNSASEDYIENPGYAIALCCVLAFVVAWAFMSIFDMASDTLLICHCEDTSGRHKADNKELDDMFDAAHKKAEEMKEQAKMDSSESEEEHPRSSRYRR